MWKARDYEYPFWERSILVIPNDHIHYHLAQMHRRTLLREAEHERLLAQLPPQPAYTAPLVAWLLRPWRALYRKWQKQYRRPIAK